MVRAFRTCLIAPLLIGALALAGCAAGTPSTPLTSPSASESASASPPPSATPSPSSEATQLALPTCDTIYSAALVLTLEEDDREPLGDVSGPETGGWGSFDPTLQELLASIEDRVSCTWILPASESGSTTSVARLTAADRSTLVAALTRAGFSRASTADGELWSLLVEDEFITYTESHLVTDELWIGSAFSFGDAEVLTLDAASSLLP